VRGPILQCQILETPLLNMINFQTLAATKAARICEAAKGDSVLEFGLRRAQGFDGALAASRAAFIGGCDATSNVLAGKLFGIPVRGTHAHSWVMCFDSELDAFRAWCDSMPNNVVLLVDTFDTHEGIRKAILMGKELEERGGKFGGIRLDSGDLAWLSREARRMLDDAGLPDALVVASNDLDEHVISSLKDQGACVGVWGVGTRLATCAGQPALGGVYKLAAIKRAGSPEYTRTMKLSEESVKVSTPGILQIRRFKSPDDGQFVADMVWDELLGVPGSDGSGLEIVDPSDPIRRRRLADDLESEDLLVPLIRDGVLACEQPGLPEIQQRARAELKALDPTVRRFLNPHRYPAGLERRLAEMRTEMMLELRS
jgi:nicotinate phosphoribosyltransferase